jgi:hypothetical protein
MAIEDTMCCHTSLVFFKFFHYDKFLTLYLRPIIEIRAERHVSILEVVCHFWLLSKKLKLNNLSSNPVKFPCIKFCETLRPFISFTNHIKKALCGHYVLQFICLCLSVCDPVSLTKPVVGCQQKSL